MADTIDPKFLDKRTAERYQTLGLLEEKDWEKHLKDLPDVGDKASPIETTIDEDEDYDDEEEASEEAPEGEA